MNQDAFALRQLVYMDPRDYDMDAIQTLLAKNAPIDPAFERLVEEAASDTGTGLIELFLARGACVDNPMLLQKATQCLEAGKPTPEVQVQVKRVLHVLIQAGVDPIRRSDAFAGRSYLDWMGEYVQRGAMPAIKVLIVQQVLDEIAEDRGFEQNTAPATGPSRQVRRL